MDNVTNQNIIDLNAQYLCTTYARFPVAFVRGQGCRLWDADGKAYLDFFASLAVMNLGQCHPAVVKAVCDQVSTLTHISNLHHTIPQARLAELLCTNSFANKVFFCNSGAEANEAAIKLARKYGGDKRDGRYEIITTLGSFHGRTMAAISATGQEKVRQGFAPHLEGFRYAPFDDLAATEAAISERTIAIMVEPIQGEGGVNVPQPGYLKGLRDLCDRNGLLLILDEVQTGMGRTGKLFAYEHEGIEPDIMTLAKALGGGIPIGAMLARGSIAESFDLGSHGSTFGGNAVACAAGVAVINTLLGGVLENCRVMGEYFVKRLLELKEKFPFIKTVRGRGLIIGAELDREGSAIVDACLKEGLLINCTVGKVLRFIPPLIVTKAEIDEGFVILERVLEKQ
ncbi:MAG: aspartate aminotransferase family protein [Deltaproteobacteria bacterium]|nr:aspartate aminotransferase family protein [Deltaproteobacteria bacterium]